jgi:para-nitrobenzyl esterase
VLKELKLDASQADNLQTIPFADLSAAGKKALKTIADKMKAEGKPVVGFGLSWGPSVDGVNLPYQLSSKEAFELSKNIPLLIGTVKNEFGTMFTGMGNNTPEQINDYIKKQYGDKAEAYVQAVKKIYPADKKPSDLIDVDTRFRPGAVVQANEKSALQGGAAVYMYLFDWQSPVFDGKYKAMHCMELPFVFDNIERCKNMTGGSKEAQLLADKVSQAWLNFAKTGNPNHKGLPIWTAYNASNTATMHFDNKCVMKPQMDKELFELVVPK